MPNIFISYRRADSSAHVGRIYDRLVQAFGKKHIFKDVDNIPVGVDFRQVLAREVNKCDIVLVVMGRYWLTVTDDYGRRRIDNPDDFVRIEVATALARSNCLVVPVLLQGAQMPPPHYLPPDLQMLCYKNAAIVRDDPDFHNDLTRLTAGLGQAINTQQAYLTPTDVKPRKRHWIRNLFLLITLFVIGFVIVYTIAYQNQIRNFGYGYSTNDSSNIDTNQQETTSNVTYLRGIDFYSFDASISILLSTYWDDIMGFQVTVSTMDSSRIEIYSSYISKYDMNDTEHLSFTMGSIINSVNDSYIVRVETFATNGSLIDTDTISFFHDA